MPMAWIPTIDESEAEGALKDGYQGVKGFRGKLSNIMQVQSLNPQGMQEHLDLYMAFMFDRSGLSREERELIAVVVSAANRCAYCVAHHAEALRAYWKDDDRVRAAAEDHRSLGLPPRIRAIVDYAELLTRDPGAVRETDVQANRREGLSDQEILSANLVTGYFNFVNRLAVGLGVETSAEEVAGYRY
jgi:uncharacterized peroxidase-related enzyme